MGKLCIDIETWPLTDVADRFNPDAVKLGNLKDPDKIEAKIEEAREKFIEDATLDARFSRVFAVGYADKDGPKAVMEADPDDDVEKGILIGIWETISAYVNGSVCGWNILGFDLPFIWQRSLILGVRPSTKIQVPLWNNSWLVELQHQWSLDNRAMPRLNDVARALGLGQKIDLGGKLAWQVCQDDPEKCREYTRKDAELTWEISERLL